MEQNEVAAALAEAGKDNFNLINQVRIPPKSRATNLLTNSN